MLFTVRSRQMSKHAGVENEVTMVGYHVANCSMLEDSLSCHRHLLVSSIVNRGGTPKRF